MYIEIKENIKIFVTLLDQLYCQNVKKKPPPHSPLIFVEVEVVEVYQSKKLKYYDFC